MAEYLLSNRIIDNCGLQVCEPEATYQTNSVSKPVLTTETERKVAELTFKVVSEEAKRLTSSNQLSTPEVKANVTRRVQQALREWEVTQHQISSSSEQLDLTELIEKHAEQPGLPSMEDSVVQALAGTITEKLMEYTIDIPRIVVLPEREVNYGFNDFNLSGLDRIALKPSSKENRWFLLQGIALLHRRACTAYLSVWQSQLVGLLASLGAPKKWGHRQCPYGAPRIHLIWVDMS